MRLLLTSYGLSTTRIRQKFMENLPQSVGETVVQILWSDPVREFHRTWIRQETQNLAELGIRKENIRLHFLFEKPLPVINEDSVIYMGGGNQYRYMKRLRDTGLFGKIRDYVEEDRLYVGVSGGSMIMCPDIDLDWSVEVNDVDLLNLSGFGYVDFYIVPHWGGTTYNDPQILERYRLQGKRIIPLTDTQAVFVADNKYDII